MPGKPASEKTMWQPTISVPHSIFDDDTVQQAPFGTRLAVGDRVFYYAYASAAVTAGRVVSAPSLIASHQADILAYAATSEGEKIITLTLGTALATN